MPESEAKYIGRYRAQRIVGSGAFATVWLAEDETLGVPVAIKVLAENWAHDEEVRNRFIEEARILWRADSDHIVRIHNVDTLADGRPYFVMDFADRGTLHERMRGRVQDGGRYSIDEAIGLSLAIAEGLKVAHALGVVHRDLKPANIMFQSVPVHHGITQDEKLILTDFGMAKSVARSRGTTIATGTPYYMAPEQTEGRADERSDIYSAGVVLYELLAGRVPYPYDSPGRLFAAQVSEPPARITTLRPDVPPAVEELLHRALAADPSQRWETAEAWTNALHAVRKGERAAPLANALPGVDPDVLRTMAPSEVAAARSSESPPPAEPPAPASGGGDGRRRRRRALAIAGPVALVAAGVAAAVIVLVVTGAKTADAKTLTLDPAAALGRHPFMPSVVPTTGTPAARLQVPNDVLSKLPTQLIGATKPTNLTKAQLVRKLATIYENLLKKLNPPIGAGSRLKLPLGRLAGSGGSRPRTVGGAAPGLYGGTQLLSVCDKRRMVAFLENNEDKLRAWASAEGISPAAVAGYINSLTDVVLQLDTRVTNHGFLSGTANAIDEVLQRGTAVLVDKFGIPRARCYCGNPLTPPRPLAKKVKITGKRWPGFSLGKTVVVAKRKPTREFGMVDVVTGTTAVYRRPGSLPSDATLTPRFIPPLPLAPAIVIPPTATTQTTSTPTVTTPTATTQTTPTPTATTSTQTTPTGTATLQPEGFDDRVGSGSTAKPDGVKDAHFRVALDAGSGATVTDILLETADQAGKPCCGQFWNTTPDSYWMLGVYRDGTRLNPTDRTIADRVSGPVVYDVYAEDSGYFKTGQSFIITVSFSDGSKLTGVTTLQ